MSSLVLKVLRAYVFLIKHLLDLIGYCGQDGQSVLIPFSRTLTFHFNHIFRRYKCTLIEEELLRTFMTCPLNSAACFQMMTNLQIDVSILSVFRHRALENQGFQEMSLGSPMLPIASTGQQQLNPSTSWAPSSIQSSMAGQVTSSLMMTPTPPGIVGQSPKKASMAKVQVQSSLALQKGVSSGVKTGADGNGTQQVKLANPTTSNRQGGAAAAAGMAQAKRVKPKTVTISQLNTGNGLTSIDISK